MENKLADTASKRPLALTIGAAAVTLVVILGVLTGPSVVTCFNSPDGMGQCLRGRMVDVGLIPAPPAAAVADTEATEGVGDAEPSEAAQRPEAAVTAEPSLDVTPPAETTVNDVVAATFGLLRAEPDGSIVIAGSGTPGSEVELFANGEPLGVATVEQSGDWVFVPDEPLPPGGLEITLGETGKPGTAAESFIVVIDEDKTTQPLVVASTPGQASEVLQGLTAPEDLALAEAEPAPEPVAEEAPEPAAEDTSEAAIAEAAEAERAADVADATAITPEEPQVAAAEEPEAAVSEGTETAAPDMTVAALPQADQPAVSPAIEPDPAPQATDATSPAEPEVEVPAGTPQVAAEEPVVVAGEPEAPAVAQAQLPAAEVEAPAVATVEEPVEEAPQREAVAAVADTLPPTIDAIEKEGNRTFFAGAGPEGGTVRLYVDDQFVADAEVEDGRWLVEAGDVLDKPNQRVRADLLRQGSADVAARAEVNFVVELPEADQPIVVAQADQEPAEAEPVARSAAPADEPAPADAVTPAPTAPADVTATPAEPASATPMPQPLPQAEQPTPAAATPAPSAAAQARPEAEPEPFAAAPAAEPATPAAPEPESAPRPRPSVPAQPARSPAATNQPATAAPAPDAEPADPVEPAADAAPAAQPAVEPATPVEPAPAIPQPVAEPAPVARPEPVAEPEPDVPTMVAVSLGDPEAQRFASGKAIIRRGDNLWTIARRVYGEGIKYTTIYDANTGQIRDPDRIYPGQVFDLPEGL
ncbi:LysM peptidoglycan-binding domain-containing protein [Devosia rhizoryzae]|uniref:LysM peptidoglycan-binding domain-containing protein n=1 Tax=Devosia rhizoryzae TaxID=2774137 RepID=A0ABX7CEJ3_9HYPH|nr:LysM peptidoglycan-binding domain-containing protein [Devosia rhizoryzae]QQR41035.1 LysM peptidoglycan-binding domain-containing protein [Devosia rhizoryzae]